MTPEQVGHHPHVQMPSSWLRVRMRSRRRAVLMEQQTEQEEESHLGCKDTVLDLLPTQ